MTLSASFCRDWVFASTLEADFEEKPSLLGDLFFGSVCNWHNYDLLNEGRFLVFPFRFWSIAFEPSFRVGERNTALIFRLEHDCSNCELTRTP
jgi:hypothetical protein